MSIEEQIAQALEPVIRRIIREELGTASTGETLSTEQAAEVAGVTPKTILQWIADGRLPAGRRGRFRTIRRADLDRVLAGGPAGSAQDVVATLRRSG